MGVYIGDIWIPYVSKFDVDRGNRRVDIVRHIDKTVPPHFAEFPNPVLSANIQGTLIQNSSSPKTSDDYAEDVLSLLDSEKAYNYIHDYQGRSGWLSVSDADSPNDADTPLSREYAITGNFLPSTTYVPRYISNPSILANDFSITFGSGGADNYIPLPKGASYIGSLDTITRATKDGDITLVKDNSAVGVPFHPTEDEYAAGECKLWDTVTPDNVTESTWKRIYNADHVFTGDCVVENGLIRLRKVHGFAPIPYLYDDDSAAWEQVATSLYEHMDGIGGSVVQDFLITEITSDIVIFKRVLYNSTNGESDTSTWKIIRGQQCVFMDYELYNVNYLSLEHVNDYDNRFVYSSAGNIADLSMGETGTNLNATSYEIGLNTTDTIFLACGCDGQTYDNGGYKVGRYGFGKPSFIGGVKFPWVSNLFKECEDMTQGSGVTFYTGADASPKTGNTGSSFNVQNEAVYYQFSTSDLPLGTYKLFVRAKDSAQVTDDLRMKVWNMTDTTTLTEELKTLTSGWAYYSIDVTIADDDDGDTIQVLLQKNTATANTIDVDYALWVPITSPNGNFPQDIAHQAMVDQNLRRELIGRQ